MFYTLELPSDTSDTSPLMNFTSNIVIVFAVNAVVVIVAVVVVIVVVGVIIVQSRSQGCHPSCNCTAIIHTTMFFVVMVVVLFLCLLYTFLVAYT